ncbi:MAG: amino acid--tRNA ligase-related protein, partial [Parachlamydiaceae bacterium]|nr:amino acid--tRNA ligase-related protein [Parachlamydiaceae bacterium]
MSKKPDYHEHEEFQNRTRKLKEIREAGINPYPHKFTPTHTAVGLHEGFDEAQAGHSDDAAAGTTLPVKLAGRLVLFRSMGKNAFGQIQDETGRIQIMFNRDLTNLVDYSPEESSEVSPYKFIEKKFDLGDIIGIEGNLFHTNKGELTVFVKVVTLLCKTTLPLADKHGGLVDKELRYRKRWLDLISHPDIAKKFRTRSHLIQQIRKYLDDHQFLEVETPILQSIYGGAEARPFHTRLNALDQEMFLRISLEIPLKKLIVGGMNRIYELGRVFRNEGIDRTHNPEFTMMEAYAAYWDYKDMMIFVETLFEKLAIELYGSTQVPYTPSEGEDTVYIDMKAPWKRLTMKEAIKEYGQLDAEKLSDEEIR